MTPEQTFLTELASGRLPALTILILVMLYVLHKGGAKLDKLTTSVEALPLALVAHRVETTTALGEVKVHTTAEANRVIKVIEDRRLSEVGDALDGVTRAVSAPEPAETRRLPTGRHAAVR